MELREKIIAAMIDAIPHDPDGDDMRAAADAILAIPEIRDARKCMCCGAAAEIVYCESCNHYANIED